jgi:hypothetical protein
MHGAYIGFSTRVSKKKYIAVAVMDMVFLPGDVGNEVNNAIINVAGIDEARNLLVKE